MKRLTALSFVVLICTLWAFRSAQPDLNDRPVYDVLFELGIEKPEHYISDIRDEDVQRGKELVLYGKTTAPDGSSSGYISKFYVCTSCHNTTREDYDLTKVNQEERLNYAIEHNQSYLQGSTFWGIVNRTSWYNDDYVKKYGDLVIEASKKLEASVQLCATVCSQGRRLEDWEMKSILSYYWSLQYKMSDLELSDEERKQISLKKNDKQDLAELIQAKFLSKSPATFSDIPKDKEKGYPFEGRAERGEQIYKLGCQHCHRPKGESDVVFNDAPATFRWFRRHITDHTQLSIYHIIRYGTYAETGHREYMPHYTLEKMSHQQVEDLRAYIELKAK